MKYENKILVVGAGPVGLMMAAELLRHGVRCRLIERLRERSPHCKALGITPRTLEVWDDLGIVNQALAAGLGLRGLVSIANGDLGQSENSSAALAEGAYGFLTLAQYDAERILAEHLESLGGRIERGVELAELQPADDRVTVKLQAQDGGVENASFQYVIGCDGGRSIVRRSLGLAFEGDHYEQVFLLADVELDWKLERGYGYKLARLENGKMLGAAACIPVPGNPRRYRFSTGAPQEMIPAELTSASAPTHGIAEVGPTLEQVQKLLTWFFPSGVTAGNMRWSAFYRISHRLVSKYRVGRIFLAGDAAHLHPPLGGQGLNTGVQDAYNLAWKLALAIRDHATDDLLDSYDAERRAIGQEIVARTTARMNQVLTGEVDTQEPVRDDSQLFLNYRNSPWVRNDLESRQQPDGPLAGDRAPDVHGLQRRYVRYDFRLFDLTRGTHYTLLVYTNHSDAPADCGEFARLAAWIEQQYSSRIQTFIVLHPDCAAPTFEGLPIMTDAGSEFARLYGAQRGSAYLIRPDGYLAYRTNSVDQSRLQNYLQRIFKA